MSGLHIAFVTFSDYPWRSGGVNQLLHSVATALTERGHYVTVYALPNFTGQPAPVLDAAGVGVEVVSVPAPLLRLRDVPVIGPTALLHTLRVWPAHVIERMRSSGSVAGPPPDVVFADFTSADPALEWAGSGGSPAVILRWANWAAELAKASRVFRTRTNSFLARENRILATAPCLCVNGRDIEADLLSRGVDSSRIVFIPSAVDVGRFSAAYEVGDLRGRHALRDKVVLFPSMLRDIKGFDHLLRAFAMLPEQMQASTSVVATGRGDSAAYRELAAELGIADAVVFLGEASADDIPRWFSLSDVAAFPYLFGAGTSVASIEALAAGLPVVAYKVQAFEYVVDDGVTGVLVDGGDVAGLADALRSILEDSDLRERMSCAAREAAVGYDISSVTDQFEALLSRLVGGEDGCA